MKADLRILCAAALVALANEGYAGPVGPLTTFTAGTTAKASEVNGNFSSVTTAVDDNNARIGTLESQNLNARVSSVEGGKQSRVIGACAAGSAMRIINADGSVVCEIDNNTTFSATAPISITGTTIGLAASGITNNHISPTAAIAVTKISGDVGIEFNDVFWSNSNIPTTVTSLGSIVVSAPGPGSIFLMLNGTAGSTGVNFLHAFGIGTAADAFGIERSVTPTTNSQPFSVNWVVPVGVAGNYTFHGLARKVDPSACCTARVFDVNLVALYVPKRY